MINSNQALLDATYQAYIVGQESFGYIRGHQFDLPDWWYQTVVEIDGKRHSIYRHIPDSIPTPKVGEEGINSDILFSQHKDVWDTAVASDVSPAFVREIEKTHNLGCSLSFRDGNRAWINKHLMERLISLAKQYKLIFNHEKPKWGIR